MADESCCIDGVSSDIIKTALHQREVRLRSNYAYQKRKYATDPEFRAKKNAQKGAWAAEKYRSDPVYAERIRQKKREEYARRKEQGIPPAFQYKDSNLMDTYTSQNHEKTTGPKGGREDNVER